ncbi:TPA: hypothetical protein PMB69_001706 [Vibrio cholerae]|nr:hypothetical protein [Vibrio cholerae]
MNQQSALKIAGLTKIAIRAASFLDGLAILNPWQIHQETIRGMELPHYSHDEKIGTTLTLSTLLTRVK